MFQQDPLEGLEASLLLGPLLQPLTVPKGLEAEVVHLFFIFKQDPLNGLETGHMLGLLFFNL
jgi:hypothetical protein